MMRVLLDINVCLDYLLKRPDHFPDAESIFANLEVANFDGLVCAVTMTTIHYIVRKEKNKDTALLAVDELMNLVEVCLVDRLVLDNARRLGFKDYEDDVQCASAVADGLDAIVTRNTKDFVNSPIPVYSPAEFLAVLEVR